MPANTERSEDGLPVLLPAGVLWDAVRTPVDLGMPVLRRLLADAKDAQLVGPVLLDDGAGCLYWFVSPGASDSYPLEAQLLGDGWWIAAPDVACGSSYRAAWAHLPAHPIVSGAAWLAAALGDQGNEGQLFGSAA
jgi:hypothetical protein